MDYSTCFLPKRNPIVIHFGDLEGTPSKEEALALPLNQYPSHIVKSQSSSKFTPKQKSIFSSQQLHEEREPQSERALDKMAFHLRK
jgi:hypothetical protein